MILIASIITKTVNSLIIIPLSVTLSIIIVNFNVKYFLEQCLLSVTKALEKIDGEVIVIDNNSSDSSREFFEGRFKHIRFIWLSENLGFGRANNLALEKASGDYILFLNPDTIVAEDTFRKCIDYYNNHENVGALGVRMIDGAGDFLKESKRSNPDLITSFYKLTGLTGLFPTSKRFAKYYFGDLDNGVTHEVDVIAGACMMIPKTVLDVTGPFDEDFFMYGEDIDLSYRIRQAGFKNVYLADTTIIHFKGESTKRGSLNYVRMFYKAMQIFVKKHYNKFPSKLYNYSIDFAISMRAVVALCFRGVRFMFQAVGPKVDHREELVKVFLCGDGASMADVRSRFKKDIFKEFNDLGVTEVANAMDNTIPVIFCEGSNFSFLSMIEALEKTAGNQKIYFYASNASAVISSNSQYTEGETLKLLPAAVSLSPVI